MYEHSMVSPLLALMPSTPPWMFKRRAVNPAPHNPSTVAEGTATAISVSSISTSVPDCTRITPAFEVVARPRTMERVTRTWLAAMVRNPWMSCASTVVPSAVTMTSWFTTASATPAGTPVLVASGLAPGQARPTASEAASTAARAPPTSIASRTPTAPRASPASRAPIARAASGGAAPPLLHAAASTTAARRGRLAELTPTSSALFALSASEILDQPDGQRRPPGLVRRAHAAPVLAVEVLVEQQQFAPVRVGGKARVRAVAGAAAVRAGQEQARQPRRQVVRDRAQIHPPPRPRRILDAQLVAVEVVVALERLDDEVVDGQPHRAAPVRVAAEQRRARLAGGVVHAQLLPAGVEPVRLARVHLRQ